jgi:hypothetical protein
VQYGGAHDGGRVLIVSPLAHTPQRPPGQKHFSQFCRDRCPTDTPQTPEIGVRRVDGIESRTEQTGNDARMVSGPLGTTRLQRPGHRQRSRLGSVRSSTAFGSASSVPTHSTTPTANGSTRDCRRPRSTSTTPSCRRPADRRSSGDGSTRRRRRGRRHPRLLGAED